MSVVNRPSDGSNLGTVIQTYMRAHDVATHADMAAVLGVDRTLVSKYVSGARKCHDVTQLRRFAKAMDLPPGTFGLVDEPDEASADDGTANDVNDRWKATRQVLNRTRHALSKAAADLYWDPVQRIEGTTCITIPAWMPEQPVDLNAVELSWVGESAPQPVIKANAPEAAPYRGQGQDGQPYNRYSQAIRALAKPSLFENRGSYRLLGLDWDSAGAHMRFGYTTYFDMIDTCEVMAHEIASASARKGTAEKVTFDDLPFRQHVGDLFDFQRRTILPSVNTLTIRRAPEGDSFFLHRRGSAHVAVAGGTSHVIPAGVFQPSGIAPWNMAGDFDIWRSILREYSEEMLGNPEHDGSSGAPIDYYAEEPFRTLNEGRRQGKVRPWCLGVGIDPLVPAGEILTVTVIESDVFDKAFKGMVATNAEGSLYPSEAGSVGIAWNAPNVRKVQTDEPLASAAAACIALTWKHRALILGE